MKNIEDYFKRHIDIIFEVILILIATVLFYLFDKRLGFDIWYSILLVILIVVLGSLAIKYLREKK